ncbi:RNA polymerase sigma factor [Dyadobacter sp.]|uniref:RNA polymerase sigma factor n=1 Tax=Dyadobacter sp. TaxID=1914288 RepID=UPI003F721C6A
MSQSYCAFSDEALVHLVCNQDDEVAFTELYRRNVKSLVGHAIRKTGSKSVAEDLVQETFVKFWLGRHKFEVRKNIGAYLNGILKNSIITHYHREQRQQIVPLEEAENPSADDTQQHLDMNVLSELYNQSLLKLPLKCRQAFELRRQGHSLKEIAAAMDISEKTVEAHISKALKILRIEMKDYIALALLGIAFV